MRVLLDSHVLLWSLREPSRLQISARAVISDPATSCVVSAASIWELGIMQGLGHLTAPVDLPDRVREVGHEILAIMPEHAWHARTLPFHHRDPFDRMLVAQAQVEDIPLVTHDRQLERYDVRIIRA